MKRTLVSSLLLLLFTVMLVFSAWAGDDGLYPLTPKKISKLDRLKAPGGGNFDQVDAIYPYQHVDENAEYYLGSGALDDTFFVVFEPPAACSVKYVEIQ